MKMSDQAACPLPTRQRQCLPHRPYLALLIAALGLSACTRQEIQHPPTCRPPTLAVLRQPNAVRDASLRRVLNHDEKKIAAATLLQQRQQIDDQASQDLMASLTQTGLPLLSTTGGSSAAIGNIGHPLSASALTTLHTQQAADVYLRWRITDYGETPVRWAGAYVAFEVVTTLAIATAFYLHKVTRPIAGVYLLEESAEELSEGYAGFWALNRLSQPVRIEADLIDGHTGAELWHASDTGLATWRLSHLWRMDDATQTELLQSSTQRASGGIVAALRQKLSDGGCLP